MDTPRHIAIVHEWFTAMRGGERCVEALCELFPGATLFALLHLRGTVSAGIERMPVRTSFIQHLPFAATAYRRYLPLFPAAVRSFDLRAFDLVITSHHCVAKAAPVGPEALHICYCHTPMRYLWDQYDAYFGRGRAGMFTRAAMRMAAGPLRRWDVKTASAPHALVANSENVRRRIAALWHRDAGVIYPPVDTSMFLPSTRDDGYFLVVSAFVPYKRVDLAIQACAASGERLVIVGDGPDAARLRAAAGPGVTFAGRVDDRELRELYGGCRGVLFPGEEDFGIVPLEAMATGKPVIAFARGGVLETVRDREGDRTGILFPEQSVTSMTEAIRRCRETRFDPVVLRARAEEFDRSVFKKRMAEFIGSCWAGRGWKPPQS
jgi:glycosyltransferase involved in cell wall biosynthesis